MNERIKLLADEAGLKYYNWSTNESNVKDGDFKLKNDGNIWMVLFGGYDAGSHCILGYDVAKP